MIHQQKWPTQGKERMKEMNLAVRIETFKFHLRHPADKTHSILYGGASICGIGYREADISLFAFIIDMYCVYNNNSSSITSTTWILSSLPRKTSCFHFFVFFTWYAVFVLVHIYTFGIISFEIGSIDVLYNCSYRRRA